MMEHQIIISTKYEQNNRTIHSSSPLQCTERYLQLCIPHLSLFLRLVEGKRLCNDWSRSPSEHDSNITRQKQYQGNKTQSLMLKRLKVIKKQEMRNIYNLAS
jgi:hypothetical protein